ncbi:MAG: Uma2 family endonuclease [Thiohalocapsa sp. PB-PSB1]|jgi:Uma2 family endonuclease|nr:MAG: Uma2 family endonuclease [Thiohalocapsa sp. PB-PSB1]
MSQIVQAEPAQQPNQSVSSRAQSLPEPIEPVSHAGRRVTEDQYWRDYYLQSDIQYEWNNGLLEEKPVSDYQTFLIYHWLTRLLDHFLKTRPIAKLVGLDMGFRLALPTGTVIRKPDLAVVHNDNPSVLLPLDCSYHGVYDLCIEALSDKARSGILRDTVQKKAEYQAGGVPEYYILHQAIEHQFFYTRNARGLYVPIQAVDGVIRSQVLPGFQFRIADLCSLPEDEALRDDPVYADFVLPAWREDRLRAEAEAASRREADERAAAEAAVRQAAEQRAETEAKRAESEAKRAESEAKRAETEAKRAETEAKRAEAQTQARIAAERREREAQQTIADLQARLADKSDRR